MSQILGTKSSFLGWLGATIMQQRGNLVLCDTFEILDLLSKFTKTSTKEMTKIPDKSVLFFVNIQAHGIEKLVIWDMLINILQIFEMKPAFWADLGSQLCNKLMILFYMIPLRY